MNSEKVGSFITECRKLRGLTQQQLADQLGITNKAVSKWETGLGMPDISIIPALTEILCVTADELLNGEKSNGSNLDQKCSSEVTEYLVNKSIIRFKMISILSMVITVIGLFIPYFIWKETRDYTGLLFGIWFELCSAGLFFAFYVIASHEIKYYNRSAAEKIDSFQLRNRFLRILMWPWMILPIVLLVSLISNFFATGILVNVIGTIILYFFLCIILFRKCFGIKQNQKVKK